MRSRTRGLSARPRTEILRRYQEMNNGQPATTQMTNTTFSTDARAYLGPEHSTRKSSTKKVESPTLTQFHKLRLFNETAVEWRKTGGGGKHSVSVLDQVKRKMIGERTRIKNGHEDRWTYWKRTKQNSQSDRDENQGYQVSPNIR